MFTSKLKLIVITFLVFIYFELLLLIVLFPFVSSVILYYILYYLRIPIQYGALLNLFIAFLIIFCSIKSILTAISSNNWEKITVTLYNYDIKRNSLKKSDYFTLNSRIKYFVDNIQYNKKILLPKAFTTEAEANEFINLELSTNPPGVELYYDPKNPKNSRFSTGITFIRILLIPYTTLLMLGLIYNSFLFEISSKFTYKNDSNLLRFQIFDYLTKELIMNDIILIIALLLLLLPFLFLLLNIYGMIKYGINKNFRAEFIGIT